MSDLDITYQQLIAASLQIGSTRSGKSVFFAEDSSVDSVQTAEILEIDETVDNPVKIKVSIEESAKKLWKARNFTRSLRTFMSLKL